MTALYVDTDPFACEWTENLIAAGHVAPGEVWNRDVWDIVPDELEPYTQVHLFSGIAVWSHALRCAGWPDDREVWTASCPCTPFSSAGARRGFADERHAWPAVLHLVAARRPRCILGEQVAEARDWYELVAEDLRGYGYEVAGLDTSASLLGFPDRERIFFAADTDGEGECAGAVDAEVAGIRTAADVLAHERDDAPGVRAVSDGPPSRMAMLRSYGNALCAPQAEAFIRSYLDT